MAKYRKKPVVIEAINWDGSQLARDNLNKFGGFNLEDYSGVGQLMIKTLEGIMTTEIGDWVIKGIKGEFYPIKNNIFLETYEPIDK